MLKLFDFIKKIYFALISIKLFSSLNWASTFLLFFTPIAYSIVVYFYSILKCQYFLFPEIFILPALLFLLIKAELYRRHKVELSTVGALSIKFNAISFTVACSIILIFVVCLYFTISNFVNFARVENDIYLVHNSLNSLLKIILILIFMVNILFSFSYTSLYKEGLAHEYFILLSFAFVFGLLCINCRNLFLLILLIEALSISLIGLVIHGKNRVSVEIGVKFFILNALFTGIGVFGCLQIYSSIASLDYRIIYLVSDELLKAPVSILEASQLRSFSLGALCLIIFLLFKLGSFPLHIYIPDFCFASLYPAIFFFLIILKIVYMYVIVLIYFCFIHISFNLNFLFLFCGLASIFVGAQCAFVETSIKKFLGYSSINQIGFVLLSLGVPGKEAATVAFIYLFVYAFSMMVFMFMLMHSFNKDRLEAFVYLNHFGYLSRFDYNDGIWFEAYSSDSKYFNMFFGGSDASPLYNSDNKFYFGEQFRFIVIVFSFIGLPPFPGFAAKYLSFYLLIHHYHYAVVLVVMLVSLLSAYYYLNIIFKIFNKNTCFSWRFDEQYFTFRVYPKIKVLYSFLLVAFLLFGILILNVSFLSYIFKCVLKFALL